MKKRNPDLDVPIGAMPAAAFDDEDQVERDEQAFKPDLTLHSPENIFHLTLTREQIEFIIAICQNDEMDWGDQEKCDEIAESLSQQTGIY